MDQTEKWFGELADHGSSVTISFRFVEHIATDDVANERGIFQLVSTTSKRSRSDEGLMPSGGVLNYARPQMDTTTSRRVPLVMGIAVLVLLLDQATKFWAESALTGRAPIPVLGEFLQLRLLYNPGAAFSIGAGSTWIFTIVAAVAVVLLARYGMQPQTGLRAAALALMLGGATTHLLDRLFRPPGFARGHVVDFLDYNGWFVGNVADIALVCGAILLVLLSFTPTKQPAE